MAPDPSAPEKLLAVATEIEAGAIVTALAEYGIQAMFTGGFTSGFKAEAPGLVTVLVKRADLARAREALEEIQTQQSEIDWSKIDISAPVEEMVAEGSADSIPPVLTYRLGWIVVLVAIAICVVLLIF